MATPAITRQHAALRKKGIDLGASVGDEQVESGGRFQQYERGRIYWHPRTGAHGLRGRILERYVQGGGPGPGASGDRELGFPTTGHVPTDDGLYECATFERGRIEDVPDTALVRIFGTIFRVWRKAKGELGVLGHPVTDATDAAGGRIAWFERGLIWLAAEGKPFLVPPIDLPEPLGY